MQPPGKVLVTGATGFLGHHVAVDLVTNGYEVIALCRDSKGEAALRLPPKVVRVAGDVLNRVSATRSPGRSASTATR